MTVTAALQEAQRRVRGLTAAEVERYAADCLRRAADRFRPEIFKWHRYYRHLSSDRPDDRPFEHPYHWAAFKVNGA